MGFENPKDSSSKEQFPEGNWAEANPEEDQFMQAWEVLDRVNESFETFLASKGYSLDDLPTPEEVPGYWIEYINSIAGLATKIANEENNN